jgi:hypothetical protein
MYSLMGAGRKKEGRRKEEGRKEEGGLLAFVSVS